MNRILGYGEQENALLRHPVAGTTDDLTGQVRNCVPRKLQALTTFNYRNQGRILELHYVGASLRREF